jgi:hypothetical protein
LGGNRSAALVDASFATKANLAIKWDLGPIPDMRGREEMLGTSRQVSAFPRWGPSPSALTPEMWHSVGMMAK